MRQYRLWIKSLKQKGFTLLENSIILVLIGVFAAMAAPSMSQMLVNAELKKSIAEVQVTFSSAQRQSIRSREGCEVGILENRDPDNDEKNTAPSLVYGECLPTLDSPLSEKTVVATNLKPLPQETTASTGTLVDPNSSSKFVQDTYEWCVDHESHGHDYWEKVCSYFQQKAPVKFAQMLYRPDGAVNFSVDSTSNYPVDPSAKLVFYNEGNSRKKPQCMVISRRLGLTRRGSYTGPLGPAEMTERGSCNTDSWDKQA